MDQQIPKHHVKQKVCATRPAYREGRFPKAVKVYTINNESKYILIQGVPSVGAMKELIKLCSNYGPVEEHHALDEYPCEDQYTEVYLVKYKKIQSARFAKRKLDDYSFFGGNLHVCYAPEYESVAETREKLQERRRIIGSKISQHRNERHSKKAAEQGIQDNDNNTLPVSSAPEIRTIDTSNLQTSSSKRFQCFPETVNSTDLFISQPDSSISQISNNGYGENSSNISYDKCSFTLPPPPKPFKINKHVEIKPKYDFSRTPSTHSTLPANFDGRLLHHNDAKWNDQSESETKSRPKTFTESTFSKESLKIKKDYAPQKQTLRFVPRQAIKRTADESSGDTVNNSTSFEMDVKIRKNAFVLGDQQGPADLPGRVNKVQEVMPGASRSYNNTIKSIRSKISQVITNSMIQKK